MLYINNMPMACALYKKSCIKVQKALWGLKTKIVYTQTNSPIEGRYLEYGPVNGFKIQHFLETSSENLDECARGMGVLQTTENGRFCLSLCYSKDRLFAAMQLSQYVDFDYCPIGKIRFAEGEEAKTLLRPFVK